MVVQVSPQVELRIQQIVASGNYSDAADVIAKAVHLLEERERKLVRLRELLAEGEESERNGNLVELTRERFEEIKESARRRAEAGERPSPHVCP